MKEQLQVQLKDQVSRVLTLNDQFQKLYGAAPQFIVRAPGRVNLIGEHTDYNEGFVLPAAIDREMLIAASPADAATEGGQFQLYSLDYNESRAITFDLNKRERHKDWSDYLAGVLYALADRHSATPPLPFNAVLSGSVPQGAGLSSSAAYEVAVATLVNEMQGLGISRKDLALLAQESENRFIGVQCGIMDQFISALAEADSALLIDCRDLSYKVHRLNLARFGMVIVITDTGVKRGLQDSQYNARREQCAEGVKLINQATGKSAKSLRDIDIDDLGRIEKGGNETVLRRCRHVISENARVLAAVESLDKGELERFGELMNESHLSLARDYEVSCPELNLLVSLTQKHEGVVGARMTGAGFGGATVAIMKSDAVEPFKEKVVAQYENESGKQASVHVCQSVDGAAVLKRPR